MTMSRAARRAYLLLVAALAAGAARAQAQSALPVFAGDPIDTATGRPHSILPGLPLILPGRDEVYGTADDVINTSVVGDVDVVVPHVPAPERGHVGHHRGQDQRGSESRLPGRHRHGSAASIDALSSVAP